MGKLRQYEDLEMLDREFLLTLNTKRLLKVLVKATKCISVMERYGWYRDTPFEKTQEDLKEYLNQLYNYKDCIKEILSKREHIDRSKGV